MPHPGGACFSLPVFLRSRLGNGKRHRYKLVLYAATIPSTRSAAALPLRSRPRHGGAASLPGHVAARGGTPGSVLLRGGGPDPLAAGLCLFDEERIQPGDLGDRKRGHGGGGGQLRRAGPEIRAADQRLFRRSHRRNGPPPGRRGGAPGQGMGRALRRPGGPRIHPARAAAPGGLRAGRDLDRHVQPRQAHLRGGARGGRAGDRRLRHLAGRHARAGGRKRHRHRLQLHAEGPGLPAGPGAHDGVAARAGTPQGAHLAGALVVSGPAAAGYLLFRPQVSPHGFGDPVLRVARGPRDGGRRGTREPLGTPPPQPPGVRRGH